MNQFQGLANLNNPALFTEQAFIAGQWRDTPTKITVYNPATGKELARVCATSAKDATEAINEAAIAQKKWRNVPAIEKELILNKMSDLLLKNKDDLAKIMTLEQGKPLAEAVGEIAYSASYLKWFAAEARRVYGDTIPAASNDRRLLVSKEPIGVVAAITPWNFPSAMLARKLAPAIAAGCAIVFKPSELTPFSALALAKIAEQAGLPAGLLSVLVGDAKEIGAVFMSNDLVKKVTFTGSTATGKLLMEQASKSLKRLSLELGGNAPFIVFDDADIDMAVSGAIASKYRNAGQTCVCANRIYVHSKLYNEFVDKYVKEVTKLKVGNGMDLGVNVGPLITPKALEKVQAHIADSLSKGAELCLGGKPHQIGGSFFEPTVVANSKPGMLFAKEETFGPVAPLFSFDEEEEVVQMANDTEFGLASYFYSQSHARIWRVAEALDYGMVGVNTGLISAAEAPFGGVKQSGFGREGSKYGLDDYLNIKYLCLAGLTT